MPVGPVTSTLRCRRIQSHAVEPARGVIVDVLDSGGVPQPGGSGARLEALLAPQGDLVLEQDGQPLAVLEMARLGVLSELAKATRHAVQSELVQQIEGGMVEHRELLSGSSAGRECWRA
jgi:hypothetical protein